MKKHLRIAALQCNFQTREQTLNMPSTWAEFGFNTEQLLHTHADMYSAVYEEARHGELMKEYQANTRAAGVRSIVYMNCHILGPSIMDRKAEWGLRDARGGYPLRYGTYPGVCLNSGWVDYFYAGLEDLKKFDIEGLFFDGPAYAPICFCPRCQAKFERKYGKKLLDATPAEQNAFYYEDVIEFKENLYAKVKSINPAWQMYFNEGLTAGHADTENFKRQVATDDIIGTEGGFFYYGPPKDHPHWHCASSAKMAEAVANGKPTVIFFAGDHKPWGWFMHTPAETRLCYMSAIGNGASVWYGIHCNPDNLKTATGAAIRDLVQFDKKNDLLYQDTRSLADVAVFFSYDTARYYRKSGTDSDLYGNDNRETDFPGDYHAAVEGAFGMLSHLNMAYDIVTELNLTDLKRYKVVVAPSLAMVGGEVQNAFDDYVRQGGVVIADGEFGLYEASGKRRKEGAFCRTAGFRATGKLNDNHTFNYCGFDQSLYVPDNAFDWIPVPPWSLKIEPDAAAEVVGRANPPMPGCYFSRPGRLENPFAVRTQCGKGRYYYFAGGCFEFYFNFTHVAWRELFEAVIRRYGANDFVLRNATTGVAMSVRESAANCTLVHLTNYTSATRPITASAVLHGVELQTPESYTHAIDLWSGKPLSQTAPGRFRLDELSEIAVIKLTR